MITRPHADNACQFANTGSVAPPPGSASVSVTATTRASGSVLCTTAVSNVSSPFHSIAVAAPVRLVPLATGSACTGIGAGN